MIIEEQTELERTPLGCVHAESVCVETCAYKPQCWRDGRLTAVGGYQRGETRCGGAHTRK